MPTAREIPALSVLITEDAPSPLNPLGLKGAGEGGANPVGAAIASAIDDALQRPGSVTQLPVTPQRLKALMRARMTAAPIAPSSRSALTRTGRFPNAAALKSNRLVERI